MHIRELRLDEQKVQPNGKVFPLVKSPMEPSITRDATLAWVAENRTTLREEMMDHGAVLLRGFCVEHAEDFEALLEAGEFTNMPYVGGAAPREQVTASRVLTANESPPEEPIPFHHEMAQVPNPPNYIFFYCDIPSATGGETAIVHSHTVYQRFHDIDASYADRVEAEGVRYRRVMPDQDDCASPIGRSWRSTFQTEDRAEAEVKMKEAGMSWSWNDDGSLNTLTAQLPAIRFDDRTGMKTFFNSIVAAYTGWIDVRNDPKKAVVLAGGDAMDADVMEKTAAAMQQECVAFKWQAGDVLLIDNRLVLHSRRPFTGERRILASIATA